MGVRGSLDDGRERRKNGRRAVWGTCLHSGHPQRAETEEEEEEVDRNDSMEAENFERNIVSWAACVAK